MKNFLMVFFCMLWMGTTSAQSNQPQTYAVVVGIAGYENPAIKGLEFANRDAQFFADWVASAQGGKVPKENLRVLLNEQATVAAIYNALEWLKENCQAGDQAYIYFSGHGDIETRNNNSKGYLLAYNTPPNNYPNNAISVDQLNADANYLTLQKKTKVCIITDACHSGKLAGDFFKGKQWVAEQLQQVMNSEVRMAACAADQLAAEGEFWDGGRGVFSYHLLRGLYGLADLNKDGQVRFEELQQYLKTAFENDAYLKVLQQKQTPITDGNPLLVLSAVDSTKLLSIQPPTANTEAAEKPIDYFFRFALDYSLESIIPFDSMGPMGQDQFARYILKKCIAQDSIDNGWIGGDGKLHFTEDSQKEHFDTLYQELRKSKRLQKEFFERFIELVQTKAQAMINAYLNGEESELEKRQYYYSGARNYSDFLPMLKWALRTVPPRHNLARVLEVDFHYLSGVVARMNMAVSKKTDSLVKKAFQHQYRTQELEPYAAYVENELANLYVHLKKFDSAQYHFDLATTLAKTWAIPWSNQIRMNLMTNDLAKADRALRVADSLQPNVSFVYMNAGLLKEKEKKTLEAISFYLRAIKENPVHYLPFERLGQLYLQTGKFETADGYLLRAKELRQNFAINDEYFRFGVELGGFPRAMPEAYLDSCLQQSSLENKKDNPLWLLLKALSVAPVDDASRISLLKSATALQPNFPYAHHYLAKAYLQQKKYAEAVPLLKEALRLYPTDSLLYQAIPSLGLSESMVECVKGFIRGHAYEQREDHYLMAHALEAQNQPDQALAYLKKAALLENQVLVDQATFKDFDKNIQAIKNDLGQGFPGEDMPFNEIVLLYHSPIQISSVAWQMRILEKMQRFEEAENVLLQQVALSRKAGDMRDQFFEQRARTNKKHQNDSNDFWVNANREWEITGIDFYIRMIQREPRNHYWKQQAATFLYERLKLAYSQLPPNFYSAFTEDFVRHAYPWKLDDATFERQKIAWPLHGLSDTINIEIPAIHPVEKALDWGQKAQDLSPETKPSFQTALMMADLFNWMDKEQEAQKWYALALEWKPKDAEARTNFAQMLLRVGNHSMAHLQMDTLQALNQLQTKEMHHLVFFQTLSGEFAKAEQTARAAMRPQLKDSLRWLLQKTQILFLQHQYPSIVSLLENRFPLVPKALRNGEDSAAYRKMTGYKYYWLARAHAMLHQPAKAMVQLEKALSSGFVYYNVVLQDPLWAKNKTDRLKKIFQSLKDQTKDQESNQGERFVPAGAFYMPGQVKRASYLSDFYPKWELE